MAAGSSTSNVSIFMIITTCLIFFPKEPEQIELIL